MSDTLFISDLHLDSSRPAVTRALEGFLQQHYGCDALYVLGDLFEVWLGDDDDSTLATEVATLFRDFTASGTPLYLMQGNRDFLLGRDFCRAVGAQLLPDPTVIEIYGQPTLLMHGDSMCTADEGYQEFRKTARDPAWQADILGHTLDERRALAVKLRTMSKDANSNKADDIMDVSPATVTSEMDKHQVRQLIHGHTHRPARHDIATGTRWVLGDWESHGWYIRANSEGVSLNNFVI